VHDREQNKNTAQKDQLDQKPDERKRVPAPSEKNDRAKTDPLRGPMSVEDIIRDQQRKNER
jgi:hypothetical protein